jgi:acetyl esterase/lipase
MAAPNDSNDFMASLPPAVRAALEAQDVQALALALCALPRDEAEALARRLVVAGVLVERAEAEVDLGHRFAYLPPAVARAVTSGNTDAVYAALAALPAEHADRLYTQLQQQGFP